MSETRWCTERQYNYLNVVIKKSNSNLEIAKKYNILTKKNKLKPRHELEKDLMKIVIDRLMNNK